MKICSIILILILSAMLWGLRYENLPPRPFRIVPADMDNDGDLDLVIGHIWTPDTEYGGKISFFTNDGYGHFSFVDSLDFYSSQKYLDVGYGFPDGFPRIITTLNDNDYGDTGIALISYYPEEIWEIEDFIAIDTQYYLRIDVCYEENVIKAIGFASQSGGHFGVVHVENGSLADLYSVDLDGSLQGVVCTDLSGDGVDELIALGSPIRIFSLADLENPIILDTVLGDHCLASDLDDDGDMDIVLCALTIYGEVTYYIEQTDSMTFETAYQESPDNAFLAEYIGDFDQDNELELVGYASIYQQISDFNFDWMDSFLPPSGYHANNYADLDGNGYNDLMFVGMGEDRGWLEILYDWGGFDFRDDPYISSVDDFTDPVEAMPLHVFPNPGMENLLIRFNTPGESGYSVSVYNIRGQRVLHTRGQSQRGENTIRLDLKDLATGIYLVDLHAGNATTRKKISITK